MLPFLFSKCFSLLFLFNFSLDIVRVGRNLFHCLPRHSRGQANQSDLLGIQVQTNTNFIAYLLTLFFIWFWQNVVHPFLCLVDVLLHIYLLIVYCETVLESINQCGYMSWTKPISDRSFMIFRFRNQDKRIACICLCV